MKKYSVLQGTMDKCGNGSLDVFKSFDTLAEARKYFNQIKKDKNGYTLSKVRGEMVVTEIQNNQETDDNAFIVDSYEC